MDTLFIGLTLMAVFTSSAFAIICCKESTELRAVNAQLQSELLEDKIKIQTVLKEIAYLRREIPKLKEGS